MQYHDIGKEGRRTGARPPEHVETNRLGVALPRAYLDSPKRGQQDNNSVVDEIEAGIESRGAWEQWPNRGTNREQGGP